MVGARLTTVPGASDWFAGGVVTYGSDVKRALLGVGPGPVVSEQAAREMALGVARLLGADVGLSLTGVAGPASQDDQPPGTVFIGLAGLPAEVTGAPLSAPAMGARVTRLTSRGQRPLVREVATTRPSTIAPRRWTRHGRRMGRGERQDRQRATTLVGTGWWHRLTGTG